MNFCVFFKRIVLFHHARNILSWSAFKEFVPGMFESRKARGGLPDIATYNRLIILLKATD